ncbi:DUF2272 domain-containing protein [Roseomonas sp. 18066]|uniref:DUF2272 domain-containing protein n=1 Tax=Roseomonas sp. 18066 TaxID=2681412 RepID=UPI001F487940|nr:DUF2272 domain-containing protein [Roseomonas sp. 18066]
MRHRGWWKAGLAMALVLAVSACASRPPPPSADAVQHLPPWRARIAAAALAEWQAWGQLTVDGWPDTLAREPDPRLFDRILTYWAAVPGEGALIIRRHQDTHDALLAGLQDSVAEPAAFGAPPPTTATATATVPLPSISLWAYPAWSAAFISHVMATAGVPSFTFTPAAAHAQYIDNLLWQADSNPDQAPFRPHAPADYAPQPGDLLCADRSRSPLLHWQDRLAEGGQFRPMHCDVVVASGGGLVQAIGGNVRDATVLRRFPADAQGRALPPPYDKPPFMLVLENRLDQGR